VYQKLVTFPVILLYSFKEKTQFFANKKNRGQIFNFEHRGKKKLYFKILFYYITFIFFCQ